MAFRPQTHCTRPRFACIPLPSLSAQPPILDPILQQLRSRTMMIWSVCEHPSTALANMALPYGEAWQDRPATSPCISSLTIWSGRRGIGLLSSLGNRLWRLAMCCGMFMSLLELQLESITNLLRGPSYSNRMPYNKSLTLMNDRCGDGFCVTCKAIILGKAYVYTIPILGGLMYGADPSLTLPISYIRNIAGGSSHMNLSGPSNG